MVVLRSMGSGHGESTGGHTSTSGHGCVRGVSETVEGILQLVSCPIFVLQM